jgi:hypothetical protein
MQIVTANFSDVFGMFWKYIIAIIAIVWFLYRNQMRYSSGSKKKMMGG